MSPDPVSPLAVAEYEALRATIRERGTTRWIVIAVTFVAWATLAIVASSGAAWPFAGVFPLLVLAAGFETVFGLHVGAERVGRYIQVRFESAGRVPPGWEHAAMAVGREPSLQTGSDPLAASLFILAAIVNLAPAAQWHASLGNPLVVALLTAVHLAFLTRVFRARQFAAAQRAADLAFFERA
jgi:hypothetical protein